jgi:16S rRNA (cytosine967-C5)-methyltransferase
MTPGARIAAAIEVLDDIDRRHRPVSESLRDWGVAHRFAGSKDRAAIGNIVYDALRWRASSQWVLGEETPRAAVLGAVGRYWKLGGGGLAAMFEGDPHAPPQLTSAERALVDLADLGAAPATVRADIPAWLASRFERSFGDDWVEEGAALALRPPLDLRVNRLKSDRDKVRAALERFGAADTPLSPDGLRIAPTTGDGRHPNVQVEPGFQKGWFEIQDEGSQLATLMAAAKPGEQILDLCAGAGGKTLALAAAMGNKGQVFATDSDRVRLAPIFDRLKRASTRNVQVRPAGASLDDLTGRMDLVLLDVPCTGTGTWRRRPDAKWRLSERALNDRIADQARLLDQAVRFLKPGGRVAYVTCSMLPDENGDQISAFLVRHKDFRLEPPEAVLDASALPEPARTMLRGAVGEHGLMLTPRRTNTDGFFIAVTKKG